MQHTDSEVRGNKTNNLKLNHGPNLTGINIKNVVTVIEFLPIHENLSILEVGRLFPPTLISNLLYTNHSAFQVRVTEASASLGPICLHLCKSFYCVFFSS